jgi:sialic acid synthase SpsE
MTYVVLEAGPTHTGLESALALCDAAAAAGADAVKFQLVQPDRLVRDRSRTFTYERLTPGGAMEQVTESYYQLVLRRYLTFDQWRQVKARCDERGIEYFGTATYTDVLEFLVDIGCRQVKVASGDVDNLMWLRQVAETGLRVHFDTGNATLGEVEAAVEAIEATGNHDMVIHHVPGGYPARLEGVDLRMVPTLKAFGHAVGFSDHSPGWDMDIAAIALGADVVEKTITLDRTQMGPEHAFSLEPEDARRFVRAVRDVGEAMGGPWRRVTVEQREARRAARRSPVALTGALPGATLGELDVEWARPQSGLTPGEWEAMRWARLRLPVSAGEVIGREKVTLG